MIELRVPAGINYECRGCGKCCSGWTVPMTEADYERISPVDWSSLHPSYKTKQLFRELTPHERKDTPYTHKIVSETGVCPFLVNNLCHIHGERGSKFKPSMCQLFPYSFNETPTGIFTTVSFVSEAVIYNSGRPLDQQLEVLEGKWQEFRQLYPEHKPDWSQIKLTVGQPITWDEYIQLESELLRIISDTDVALPQRLLNGSAFLVSQIEGTSKSAAPSASPTPTPALKPLDLSLLLTFHKMYYPVKALKRGACDFGIARLLGQHFLGSTQLPMPGGQSLDIADLHQIQWPDQDKEIASILDRYIYSNIFGKKYFGAGFGQVSMIAGFHHLILMIVLIKLQSRASARLRAADIVSLIDVGESVKEMERRVGETKLGGYTAAAWELLLFPPGRAQRLLLHC